MTNDKFITFLVVFSSLTGTYLHLAYTVDSLARHVGYVVSIAVLPFITGSLVGYLGSLVLRRNNPYDRVNNSKDRWWLIILGAGSALLPVGFGALILLQSH